MGEGIPLVGALSIVTTHDARLMRFGNRTRFMAVNRIQWLKCGQKCQEFVRENHQSAICSL
jgi:hypothetical protein